jgi:hypothetical protein
MFFQPKFPSFKDNISRHSTSEENYTKSKYSATNLTDRQRERKKIEKQKDRKTKKLERRKRQID